MLLYVKDKSVTSLQIAIFLMEIYCNLVLTLLLQLAIINLITDMEDVVKSE